MFRVSSRETFDRGKIFYYYTLIRNVNSQPTQETLKGWNFQNLKQTLEAYENENRYNKPMKYARFIKF